jgi:hypothetical protein
MIRIFGRILALYLRNPAYRAFIKEMSDKSQPAPKYLSEYLGYGLYVGRKPN